MNYLVKICTVLLIFCISNVEVGAQIVDDTTQLIYGPHSTQFTREVLFLNNVKNNLQNIDTSVYRFELYNRVDRANRQYQGLGFLGTPLFDLNYNLPVEIGRQSGFDGYDLYFKNSLDFKYFNTKSPFLDLKVVLGGNTRTKIDVGFTRNFNKNLNFGFNVNRITADKQIGANSLGDRSTESSSVDFYFRYKNQNHPYQAAYHILFLTHQVSDIGGVKVGEGAIKEDFFQYNDSETFLKEATSRDRRIRHHFIHEYTLGSGFQIYHQLNYVTQTYQYEDIGTTAEFQAFYPQIFNHIENATNDTTNEKSNYSEIKNEVGFKGDIKGVFYRFFAKNRILHFKTKTLSPRAHTETYVGTFLRFQWKDKFTIQGIGEISNEGLYKIRGSMENRWLWVQYTSMRSSPSYLMEEYSGNHHRWSQKLLRPISNKLEGKINIKWKNFTFQPQLSFTTLTHPIYITQEREVAQNKETLALNQYGGNISIQFLRGLKFLGMNQDEFVGIDNQVVVSQVLNDANRVINTPTLRYSGRIYWSGKWFKNTVPIELGSNLYFRTGYYGNGYDPVISQFYLQKSLELLSYLAVDLFVNIKVKNLRAFVKWTHVNQRVNDGYMTTPFFPDQKSILDFGVQWLFFD